VKDEYRWVCVGSLDDSEAEITKPQREIFCKYKAQWMADVPGE